MTDTETDQTATVTWNTEEARFVKMVLKTAGENDMNIERSMNLIHEMTGMNVAFVGGTEEFYEDPPSPSDLLRNFEGGKDQQWTGTRTDYEALQTCLTVFIHESLQAGQPVYEEMEVIDDIHRKIRGAVDELGGETVGADGDLFGGDDRD